MNNYLGLNLVSGKLNRVAGGGKPRFILNEQNEVQLYILDFPKPSTYPTGSLADAYAYEIIPRNFNTSNVTLNAGVRGGNVILSANSFSNLPTNLTLNASGSLSSYQAGISSNVWQVFDLLFSVSSIPVSGSLFSITVTITRTPGAITQSFNTPAFSFENKISDIATLLGLAIDGALLRASSGTPITIRTSLPGIITQSSDYSYSFNKQTELGNGSGYTFSVSYTLNNISASSNPGKYGYLDFSSSSWDSVIGTKTEAQIWMEAMIGSDTIAQGNAIICRKMT